MWRTHGVPARAVCWFGTRIPRNHEVQIETTSSRETCEADRQTILGVVNVVIALSKRDWRQESGTQEVFVFRANHYHSGAIVPALCIQCFSGFGSCARGSPPNPLTLVPKTRELHFGFVLEEDSNAPLNGHSFGKIWNEGSS